MAQTKKSRASSTAMAMAHPTMKPNTQIELNRIECVRYREVQLRYSLIHLPLNLGCCCCCMFFFFIHSPFPGCKIRCRLSQENSYSNKYTFVVSLLACFFPSAFAIIVVNSFQHHRYSVLYPSHPGFIACVCFFFASRSMFVRCVHILFPIKPSRILQ